MDQLSWSEFGVTGVVIAALLYALFKMLTMLNDREIQYREERQKAEERHRDERKDWHDRRDVADADHKSVLRELTQAIHDKT